MVKYLKAGASVLNVPEKVVFTDKKGKDHLLPTLSKKEHHIASHYGLPAITTVANVKSIRTVRVKRGDLVKFPIKTRAAKKPKLTVEEKSARKIARAMAKANKVVSGINTVKKDKKQLVAKLTASTMADDIFNAILPAAMATVTRKRGRPLGSKNKKKAQ
jgi:hypothetical protein